MRTGYTPHLCREKMIAKRRIQLALSGRPMRQFNRMEAYKMEVLRCLKKLSLSAGTKHDTSRVHQRALDGPLDGNSHYESMMLSNGHCPVAKRKKERVPEKLRSESRHVVKCAASPIIRINGVLCTRKRDTLNPFDL